VQRGNVGKKEIMGKDREKKKSKGITEGLWSKSVFGTASEGKRSRGKGSWKCRDESKKKSEKKIRCTAHV